jgi:hypothetical protein
VVLVGLLGLAYAFSIYENYFVVYVYM